MATLQDLIYKFEEGSGSRYVRLTLGIIVFVTVASVYNLLAFRNLALPEAMDAAQLARNVSQGEGFSTDFVRPLSLHLLGTKQLAGNRVSAGDPVPALPPVTGPHPDLANPPLYPLLLSIPLKLMPASFYEIDPKTRFSTFKADRWISFFNQFLICVAAGLVFLLALRLFDEPVAWVSSLLFVGGDLFWQFSLSGLSTVLLMVIFLGLALVLTQIQVLAREEEPPQKRLLYLALAAGLIVGLGALTRYSFAWALIPLAIVIMTLPGRRQGVLAAVAVSAALVVMGPWLIRNYSLSGTLFGTAGYSVYQETAAFPGNEIQRALDLQLGEFQGTDLVEKLLKNCRTVIEEGLPRLGGSWMTAFFLVGLLLPFKNPSRSAVRSFLLGCLGVFALAQSMVRTSGDGSVWGVTAENLLVILAPVVIIYGTSLFFILLDQTTQLPWVRYLASAILWVIVSAPMLFTLISPPVSPVTYPPYFPPWIKEKAQRVEEKGAVMTDIPWAVAWYGERRAVWLSLFYQNSTGDRIGKDFAALQAVEPVDALYLTGVTLKDLPPQALHEWRQADGDMEDFLLLRSLLVGNWEAGGDTREDDLRLLAAFRNGLHARWQAGDVTRQGWESFVVGALMKQEVPSGFPFRAAFEELLPEIFLTDSERIRSKPIQSE